MERNCTSPYYIDISPCSVIINYYDYIYYNSVEEDNNVSCSIIYEKGVDGPCLSKT